MTSERRRLRGDAKKQTTKLLTDSDHSRRVSSGPSKSKCHDNQTCKGSTGERHGKDRGRESSSGGGGPSGRRAFRSEACERRELRRRSRRLCCRYAAVAPTLPSGSPEYTAHEQNPALVRNRSALVSPPESANGWQQRREGTASASTLR